MRLTLAGINVQWPWSRLLINGEKTVETRTYPIPPKYLGQELALIETPGPSGKKVGITHAQIIGTITFSESFLYKSRKEWAADSQRHQVRLNDPQYGYHSDRAKWGWKVDVVKCFAKPQAAPKKKGIVFASECLVELPS